MDHPGSSVELLPFYGVFHERNCQISKCFSLVLRIRPVFCMVIIVSGYRRSGGNIFAGRETRELSTGIHGRSLIFTGSSLTDAQLSLTLVLALSALAGSCLLAEFKGCYFDLALCESSPIPNILNR